MDSAKTVAVVVPSPAMSLVLLATSRTIWAPMFSYGSSSSISFATVKPPLVMLGEPNFLSRTTLRPFGPSVTLTARLSFSTPRSNALRASSSNNNCFAAMMNHSSGLLFNHAEDVFLAHDEIIFAINLDLRAAILADQHAITFLHRERDELAVIVTFACAQSDHFALLGFFLCGVGNDDPALFHFFLVGGLYQHPIAQWFYVHVSPHSFLVVRRIGASPLLLLDDGQASRPSNKFTSFSRPSPSRNRPRRRRLLCPPSSRFRP